MQDLLSPLFQWTIARRLGKVVKTGRLLNVIVFQIS